MSEIFYDAFISYSTKDAEFVAQLRLALELGGRRVWQDVKELELTEKWWEQIKFGIFNSDNFLFIVSPRSLASPICHLELEYARELNKRVIIINYENADKEVSTRAMVDRLLTQNYLKILTAGRDMFGVADENWTLIDADQNISIQDTSELLEKVPKLVAAFDKDLGYIRQSNILLGRAQEWKDNADNANFLLMGDALKAAKEWQTAGKQPAPSPLHQAYIQASQNAENERERIKREQETRIKTLGRARQTALMVGIVAALFAVGASVYGIRAVSDGNAASTREYAANQQSTLAIAGANVASTQISDANSALTAVPPTLTLVNQQVITAEGRANIANTEVAQAQATATQIPPTLTQAAVVQIISEEFANTMLQDTDNPSSQIARMNQLIGRYPNQALAYQSRGLVHAEQGHFDLAIADYDRAIELDPQFALAYSNRGVAYRNLGEVARAIQDYDRAIELDPLYATAYNNRGTAHGILGDDARAIEDYDRAIELDPLYATAYNNRGTTHGILGDYERAIADFDRAIELNPNDANAYRGRGVTFYLQGGDYYPQVKADFLRYQELTGRLEPFMEADIAEMDAILAQTATPTP